MSSCLAPTFDTIFTQPDPFRKLQELIGSALKDHPRHDQIQEFLTSLRDLSRSFISMEPEEKQKLAADFLRSAKSIVEDIKGELVKQAMIAKLQSPNMLLLIAVVILAFIFVFFGYKLYKSLTEKERKREEKLKAKQSKKKK